MAKKEKVWRVLPEYEGRVTIESECKPVVLSGDLSQEQLLELSKNPVAAGFLECATQNVVPDEG